MGRDEGPNQIFDHMLEEAFMKFSNKLAFTIFATGLVTLILLSVVIFKFNYNAVIKEISRYVTSSNIIA